MKLIREIFMKCNIGKTDRYLRIAAGIAIIATGIFNKGYQKAYSKLLKDNHQGLGCLAG